MLHFTGREKGLEGVPGVPAKDLTDTEISNLEKRPVELTDANGNTVVELRSWTEDDLVASGCFEKVSNYKQSNFSKKTTKEEKESE